MKTNRRVSKVGRKGAYLLARAWHGRNVFLVLLAYLALFAWLLGSGGEDITRPASALVAPENPAWERPSKTHWFGTAGDGSDLFTLSRIAMATTAAVSVISACIGAMVSLLLVSLFLFDASDQRFRLLRGTRATVRVIPAMAILCLLVGGAGGGLLVTVATFSILLGLQGSGTLCRWLEESEDRPDLVAGAVLGLPRNRLLKSRVLPGMARRLAGLVAAWLPPVMLAEMGLAFLGLRGGALSCGSLIASGLDSIMEAPWLTIWPGAFAAGFVLLFSLLGGFASHLLRFDEPEREF